MLTPVRCTRPALAAALALILAAASAGTASAGRPDPTHRLDPALARFAAEHPAERAVAWVFFTDRAGAERDPAAFAALRRTWPERSLRRRLMRGTVRGLQVSDLPVHAAYVRALAERGLHVRGASRWVNAASVEGPAERIAALAALPFVARVAPVPTAMPTTRDETFPPTPEVRIPRATSARGAGAAPESMPGDQAYYGASYDQLALIQVPQLHALGLSGAGVLVCMIDTGYETTHEIYQTLHVLATRDFINGDTNVAYDSTQDAATEAFHGTATLACVAGSLPGVYSGVAFNATVALAKTEDVSSETPIEMDYWQFAAEWADSLGADVISTSLGYTTFDSPWPSYTYADMDGHTTVVARAAIEAIRRGITVVAAAGNYGAPGNTWHYIVSPADADTLIAAGAVDGNNHKADFSSFGPSSDGRIKPDVTAQGAQVLTVSDISDTAFYKFNGTSFACPLTAGVAALLLESHPAWGPYEVRAALRATALNHAAPNDSIGWGLVQGLAANAWVPTTGAPKPVAPAGLSLAAGPNPLRAGGAATITFAAPGAGRVSVDVIDVGGRRLAQLFDGTAETPERVSWRGTDGGGRTLPAGLYWLRLATADGATARTVRVVLLD